MRLILFSLLILLTKRSELNVSQFFCLSVFYHSVFASDFSSFSIVIFFMLASKSVSDAKTVMPMVKQPVFLRSMSAPSDLEMIANQDLEFTHAPQRYFPNFV